MTKNIYIEDTKTGSIRIHKNVQQSLQRYAKFFDRDIPSIRTKQELADALAAALAGAGIAEVIKIAEKHLE